ncbi:MAG TPA: hypothetical protein PKB10_07345 [Tepidisphaeraceae bacterium]|nr:hypothetical protein [Tepidisphaeraceae bacterium]
MTMKAIPLEVDQVAQIGQHTRFWATDIDPSGVRVLVDGQLVGGPDDGQPARRDFELALGGAVDLGPMLKITLLRVTGKTAHFGVLAPGHFEIRKLREPRGTKGE